MSYKQAAALRGFLEGGPDNFYQGVAGQLPGSADFSAVCLFRVWNPTVVGIGNPQALFGNMPAAATSGWQLELAALSPTGVTLQATAVDSIAGAVSVNLALTVPIFVGKLIHLAMRVVGGDVQVHVQGVQVDSAAVPNAFVPGVGAPTIGQYNDGAGGTASGIDILGCAYKDGALDDAQISANFFGCAEASALVDLPYPSESQVIGGFDNLWHARNLRNPGVPGVLDRGSDGVELLTLPLPLPTWVDSRDPSVFAASPFGDPNAPLISLAANEFNVAGSAVGVVGVPNPTWM